MPKDTTSTDLVPVLLSKPPAPAKGNAVRTYTKRNPGGPRVPPADGDIQSNFCRNINCENFGVAPAATVPKGRPKKGQAAGGDGYRIAASGRFSKVICLKCGQIFSMKSNTGIREELDRISAYLTPPPDPSCPNAECANHGASAYCSDGRYRSKGYTEAGTKRWTCKACGARFSDHRARRTQPLSHKNARIFALLVNKAAIRPMTRIEEIGIQTLYSKIEFIHRQCLAFLGDRESRIADLKLKRLYISTDRQDHVLNWSSRKDRKNTCFTAIGSSENRSGYVFAMNANFDPSIDTELMEAHAIVAGDFEKKEPAFRKFARLWTTPDHEISKIEDPIGIPVERIDNTGDVFVDIRRIYDEMDSIPDAEAKERTPRTTRLPSKGAQVHLEYATHAHFRLLRRLLGDFGKARFFMDQDDTLRAACISTFAEEMRAGRADCFMVKIDKGLNVDQRQALSAASTEKLNKFKKFLRRPKMSDWWARVLLLMPEILTTTSMTPRDRWVAFPDSTLAEPLKAVCWLTYRQNVVIPLKQLAIVFARASMHSIDRYFMQIRRLMMALERPIYTPSSQGCTWHGYSLYDPARLQQLLDIYRCYHNFIKVGDDGRTPAMRLGLAKGVIRYRDVLAFEPGGRTPYPRR